MAAKAFFLPFRPAIDANGLTVPGAQLYFYATGTTTPQAIYSDTGLTTPLTNPVEANSAGRWPTIYLNDALTYRVVLKDGDGVTLADQDPYLADVADAVTSSLTAVANAVAANASTASAAAATATTQAGYATSNATAAAASAASALNAPGTSATSTTSLTIGTGSKSLTLVQTDKAFALGQFVMIASTASPTNYMIGQITAFTSSTGAMTVTVSQVGGSGTISAWTVSLSASGGMTSSSTDTLTNKTIDLANNTLTGTAAQFNAALSGADFALAGWTQIAQLTTTSGASQTFTSIPQTYADLLVVPACSHNSAGGEALRMDISDDNGSNWSGSFSTWSQTAADTIRGQIFIPGYRVGTGVMVGSCPALATNRTLNMRTSVSSGAFGLADWRADAGINALRFTNSGGAAFDAGTITLYGR